MKCRARADNLVLWVLVALVVLSPLPEGSTYPWALPIIEAAVFALMAVWVLVEVFDNRSSAPLTHAMPFLLPLLFLAAVAFVQLVPLPPGLIRVVSPATYRLYESSLSGWPQQRPYEVLRLRPVKAGSSGWIVLPTVKELDQGKNLPFGRFTTRKTAPGSSRDSGRQMPVLGRWRPLSIAPSMSSGVLLELAAYAALFFVVLLYPFGWAGGESERRLWRALVMAAMLSGLIVAVIGVVEFFTWNGKILWLFVPYDVGAPQPGIAARASGSFVNPDHFGNYLASILPLAVGGALFRSDLFERHRAFRVLSGTTAFFVFCALLLSLSRVSWIAAAVALAILFFLSARILQAERPRLSNPSRSSILCRAGALGIAAIALSLIFVGSQGRQQVDLRLRQTVYSDSGFSGRLELAGETLAMVRDFPLLGVGLGCWPELFPHYHKPPWNAVMYREAHNDYAQLLAETGIAGFTVAAWFFIVVGWRIYHALAGISQPVSPTFAAVCAALAVMVLHEFFDFSLHIPANAVLFTVMLALAVRMAAYSHSNSRHVLARSPAMTLGAVCMSILAIVLIVCASVQEKIPYPHNIHRPKSMSSAIALISAHPAESSPHMDLVRLAGGRLSAQERLNELRAAVWLDQTNPYPRDLYARALLEQGMKAQALDNLSRSVLDSPSLSTHFYLRDRIIPWLSAPERKAVEQGFADAIARGYDGAIGGLAGFYIAQNRFADAAEIYSKAANVERDRALRENYLVGAGLAYAQTGDTGNAEKLFNNAIRNEPADDGPYRYLTTLVLGPRHQLKAAQDLVAEGVRAGADGPALYVTLAAVAQNDNDRQLAESALRHSVDLRPSFDALFRLGVFYLHEGKYDRAALMMRRATESNPRSADAYFYLGVSEESDYRFSDAERDLLRAVQLAPTDARYRAQYTDFERKVAQNTQN